MNTPDQLAYCEQCKNYAFSSQKGIVCGLTDDKPAFIGTCDSFEIDEERSRKYLKDQALKEEARKEAEQYEQTNGMSQMGVKRGSVAGVILMVLAVLWFFGGIIYLNRIFFYPPILFIVGLVAMIKGIIKERETKNKSLMNRDLLDDRDL